MTKSQGQRPLTLLQFRRIFIENAELILQPFRGERRGRRRTDRHPKFSSIAINSCRMVGIEG